MTARKPMLGDIVRVRWLDAWADHDTTEEKDWEARCEVTTYGELRRLTKDLVSIAGETVREQPPTFRCVTHVPRAIVLSIEVLARPRR